MSLRVKVLDALPLSHRINGEHEKAAFGERNPDGLVIRELFAVGAVSGDAENGGVRFGGILGNVNVSRDIKMREALVDELLDPIAGAVNDSRDFCMQRSSGGKTSNLLENGFSYIGLAMANRGLILNGGNFLLPLSQLVIGPLVKILADHSAEIAVNGKRLTHGLATENKCECKSEN